MTRFGRISSLQAALLAGIGLAGCAPPTDYSAVSTSPVTMACDGGKSFTVSYTDGFETAIIEVEGRRLQLQRVRTTLGATPTPGLDAGLDSSGFGNQASDPEIDPGGGGPSVGAAGTIGVRYSSDDAYYLSRNRVATLEEGDEIYSNCRVAR